MYSTCIYVYMYVRVACNDAYKYMHMTEQYAQHTVYITCMNIHVHVYILYRQNIYTVYMLRAIWEFAQSAQSAHCVPICRLARILWIFSLHNTICRLRKFPDCTEHIHVLSRV